MNSSNPWFEIVLYATSLMALFTRTITESSIALPSRHRPGLAVTRRALSQDVGIIIIQFGLSLVSRPSRKDQLNQIIILSIHILIIILDQSRLSRHN